ncbi:bifunctional phosphopantothenoylcysteine decarboxylase/phosphopantothenate--cysteine ligase CoaBC [Alkalicoccobacillus porphyridii]|uniref:Coenzyme A biosynthesis bifunctional protein CoaBC n=1 Tax=Alkalicoccobacillus porphyridii TaxID=2597270 RepID=A0A553ZYI3_9BACI|nr:bifunctional phosphopantothenoylcysteine decarboxylase/phosphopantothenate--cysteine ligase CoaBC [Alkalicoccobacillus porphyridii]TSB46508.1 bifunctional phosphopantothenoylcysteine decarboxylase/phosphopantothenate--cysteine ligase CoaBC [Alkalicoccobacillus porphyridii]
MLAGKKILLGVTGGIASYKACDLTSKLVQAGAEVKVMMTQSAQEFVKPLTFQALSRNPVYIDTFTEPDPEKIAHIDIADWADACVIAPATANMIAKLANGLADDMVSTTVLATLAPVYIAPAMNINMYNNPAVQENMKKLDSFGYQLFDSEAGYLACGWVGKGRMAEPKDILNVLQASFEEPDPFWKSKKVLITAGPTREAIDPVRYFSNHSSGKMGYAIAEAAAAKGAKVELVSGPTNLEPPPGVVIKQVITAEEMYDSVTASFSEADVTIKSAAVADYRPVETYNQKRKKNDEQWNVELESTKDILKTLGTQKTTDQILVGFAAESENVAYFAKDKLERKNLDLIVANDISADGAGFNHDTNVITIFNKHGQEQAFPMASKKQTAEHILEAIKSYTEEQH